MSQRYLVTARKYRPKLFRELAAQEHVTSTLKNAIRLDRLSHAYLFSGPRGVGKTTAARILAKAINCSTPLEEREDQAEPCRQCDSCMAFEEGRSLDIIELDAASNNKVDDIRELRETVRIPPQGSKKKVYIIDEVHMLSTQAFNALLKTLEEPPPHALFIFATTEPNKVLPTILSRCQRFDFRRIPVSVIVERLKEVSEEEDISYDENALLLLARKGNGALRDAFSAFDQAVVLCGADLRYDELARALGVVDVDLFFEVTDNVREQATGKMLRLVERIVQAGYDFQEFLEGLGEHLRNVLVACTLEDASLIEATDAIRARYAEAGKEFSEPDLLRLLLVVGEARREARGSIQPRLQLEMTLLKLANMARAADLQEVIGRLDAMKSADAIHSSGRAEEKKNEGSKEKKVKGLKESGKETERHLQESGPAEDKLDKESKLTERKLKESELAERKLKEREKEETLTRTKGAVSNEREEPAGESSRPDPAAGRQQYQTLFNKPALSGSSEREPSKKNGNGGGAPHNYGGNQETLAVAEPTATMVTARQKLEQGWAACVAGMRQDRMDTATLMKHATPQVVADGHLVLHVPDAFHRGLLHSKRKVLRRHIGETLGISLERVDVAVTQKPQANGTEETASKKDPYDIIQQKRKENPALEALFTTFGGEIVR